MIKANISYHQRSLDVLERLVPQMEEQIGKRNNLIVGPVEHYSHTLLVNHFS